MHADGLAHRESQSECAKANSNHGGRTPRGRFRRHLNKYISRFALIEVLRFRFFFVYFVTSFLVCCAIRPGSDETNVRALCIDGNLAGVLRVGVRRVANV
jgi:hypothetical protein